MAINLKGHFFLLNEANVEIFLRKYFGSIQAKLQLI